jgi:hypothetical protein
MPSKRFKWVIHTEVATDILKLPDQNIRLLALNTIKGIVTGKIKGSALEDRRSTGDLSDCMKVPFDTRRDIPPRFRAVYKQTDNLIDVVMIEVLSVGERFQLEAYISAALRLNRDNG